MIHSTTLRCPDLYIIFSIESSGVELTGGNVSSSCCTKPRACKPTVSSILREVDIAVLKECRNSACSSEGKLRCFTLIHQVVTLI